MRQSQSSTKLLLQQQNDHQYQLRNKQAINSVVRTSQILKIDTNSFRGMLSLHTFQSHYVTRSGCLVFRRSFFGIAQSPVSNSGYVTIPFANFKRISSAGLRSGFSSGLFPCRSASQYVKGLDYYSVPTLAFYFTSLPNITAHQHSSAPRASLQLLRAGRIKHDLMSPPAQPLSRAQRLDPRASPPRIRPNDAAKV